MNLFTFPDILSEFLLVVKKSSFVVLPHVTDAAIHLVEGGGV